MSAPARRIGAAGLGEGGRISELVLRGNQSAAEEPGRLNCHGDTLGDDGMGLARGVAGAKQSIRKAGADARPDRAGGMPALATLGAGKRVGYAPARPRNVPQHGVAGALLVLAASAQGPPGDAAGETGAALIAPYHAAIPAGKNEERHQIGRKVGAVEMRLEGDEVGRAVRRIAVGKPS